MPATPHDITIEQGATYELGFVIDVGDAPYDLTGAVVRMTGRKTPRGRLIFEASTENGLMMVDDPASGEVVMVLPALMTATFPVGDNWVYDLEIEHGDVVRRLLIGTLIVSADVVASNDGDE